MAQMTLGAQWRAGESLLAVFTEQALYHASVGLFVAPRYNFVLAGAI